MKTILVDDEWWSISQLQLECDEIEDIDVVGRFDDPFDALEYARNELIELAFLDVEMPGMNGIELAAKLREVNPAIMVVFVSAYDRYIADIRDGDAICFVTKPYTSKDIIRAIDTAKESLERSAPDAQTARSADDDAREDERMVLPVDDPGGTSLQDVAERDMLTGLFNYSGASMVMAEYLEHAAPNEIAALLLFDIDDFRALNEAVGRASADTVLVDIAALLRATVRSSDMVARVGADEMVVFLKGIPGAEFARDKAQQLTAHIAEHAPQRGGHSITVSCGVAISPYDASSAEDLIACARAALASLNERGGQGPGLYSRLDDATAQRLLGSNAVTPPTSNLDGADLRLFRYLFMHFRDTPDLPSAVSSMLSILGRRFDVSRAYVYELADGGTTLRNTFEWCAAGVVASPWLPDTVPEADFDPVRCFATSSDDILSFRDRASLPADVAAVFSTTDAESVLQCLLRDEGDYRGFIGFDECRQMRYWDVEQRQSLTELAMVLSVFLHRYRLEHGDASATMPKFFQSEELG